MQESQIGKYEVISRLGGAQDRIVYKVLDPTTNRSLAIKTFAPGTNQTESDWQRFERETRTHASVRHPNVLIIHENLYANEKPHIVMELAEGGTLAARLDGIPWLPAKAARLVELLAGAVQAIHDRGVVHRDINPHHVLFTSKNVPKLTGFRRARFPEFKVDPTLIGCPAFCSPEILGYVGAANPKSDVWSLGVLLYQLLTGKLPFEGQTAPEVLNRLLKEPAMPPRQIEPSIPADLESICLKCLENDPNQRTATAKQVASQLRRHGRSSIGRLWYWLRGSGREGAE